MGLLRRGWLTGPLSRVGVGESTAQRANMGANDDGVESSFSRNALLYYLRLHDMQGGSYNVGIRGQSDMRKLILQRQFVFVIYERMVGGGEPACVRRRTRRQRAGKRRSCVPQRCSKNEISCKHGFELTRIEGSYAHRCSYMKSILIKCFAGRF